MTERSHSELACYQTCNRKWYHRYVDRKTGLITPERLTKGKEWHAWMAERDSGARMVPLSLSPSIRTMAIGYAARYDAQDPDAPGLLPNASFVREIAHDLSITGEIDALALHVGAIVEHKTTSSDITPGSSYWRRVSFLDRQVNIYLLAFPEATHVLYDVIRKPAFRTGDVESKALADMADNPDKYFQRAKIVRMESELRDVVADIRLIDRQMRAIEAMALVGDDGERLCPAPRNPNACHDYGDECEFFAVCWKGKIIDSMPEWNDESFECQRGRK